MNRLIIESIEGRITLGITMFVAIMVLIGWVAINEPARMAAFERQHLGRSIERGAELFAANCSTCHGANGLGIAERAPAINNPQMFGYNFLASVNSTIARLERTQSEINSRIGDANREREALITETSQNPTSERLAEIATRIREIDDTLNPDVEGSFPAQIATIDEQLAPLLEERAALIEALLPAVDKGYLPLLESKVAEGGLALTEYIARDGDRLSQAGWGGDLASLLRTTLIHGRPGTQDAWGGTLMVSWSQLGGGPLRYDQVDDIVNYMLNWNKGDAWTLEDLYAVNQFMKLKADAALVSGGDRPAVVGSDVNAAYEAVIALTGDAAAGKTIYNGEGRTLVGTRLGCSSCHLGGLQAPDTEKTWENTENVRLALPQFASYDVERYLIESILQPNAYVVDGYASGVMPMTYPEQLSAQDLANIIAYLKTYSE